MVIEDVVRRHCRCVVRWKSDNSAALATMRRHGSTRCVMNLLVQLLQPLLNRTRAVIVPLFIEAMSYYAWHHMLGRKHEDDVKLPARGAETHLICWRHQYHARSLCYDVYVACEPRK